MKSISTTFSAVRLWRIVHMKLFALAWLLAGIAGCETPHRVSRRCEIRETVGLGFTPTRWNCWQNGPLAYRNCPAAACDESQNADVPRAERLPIPGAPAAEIIPPGPDDEVPPRPAKPAPRPQEPPAEPGGTSGA